MTRVEQFSTSTATTPTSSVSYEYDALDRRIARTQGSAIERYVYDGDQILMSFGNGGGTQSPRAEHLYLYSSAVDQVLADERLTVEASVPERLTWLLADAQGTVRDLVAGSGTATNHRTFDSFGRLAAQTNTALDTLFAYTGRPRDPVTGLQDHQARWYDPATGRFLSEDPLGFAGGDENLYGYVGNNSLNAVDRDGRQARNTGGGLASTGSLIDAVIGNPFSSGSWSSSYFGGQSRMGTGLPSLGSSLGLASRPGSLSSLGLSQQLNGQQWSSAGLNRGNSLAGQAYQPQTSSSLGQVSNYLPAPASSTPDDSSFAAGTAWGLTKTVAVGGASILALGGLAAIAPLAAVGAGALFVGYLGRNYLYDYADRLNAGQTDAQAIQGSLIGNTPALGGLYRGLTNTDPGTGASLNLSHFEQGNQFGSGLGEAALLVKGPQIYRVGNATARAASDVVTSLRARAELYGSANPIPEGYTRAYRAVSEAEYQQVLQTGRFEVPPGRPGFSPMEGKWFADSLESASAHGNALQGPGKFRLIEADLPNNAPSLYQHPNIDGRGPGRYLDINDLNGVTPRPVR